MTMVDPSRKPELIELGKERILLRYRDRTVQVDQDVATEKGVHLVDIFTEATDEAETFRAITTHDKFRADAARWGKVRPELATASETRRAQFRFEESLVFAHELFAAFKQALDAKKIVKGRVGDRVELFWIDTNEDRHLLRLIPASAGTFRLGSLELEDEDGMHLAISDPELLKPLRARLEYLLRWQIVANAKLRKK
ncbi:MAG: hypothetical protein U1F66_11660 [bacterium]